MDYDKTTLPDQYDAGRSHGQDVLDLWMRTVGAYAPRGQVKCILDLGCGTGRFTESLAAYFDANVVGLDPSQKMLRHANAKRADARVHFERGHAEAIPLATGSVDLIFMSMSLHHFRDQRVAAGECRRVLRAGGTLFMRTGTSTRANAYPYTRFFPSSFALMQEHLPSVEAIRGTFEGAGFRTVATTIIEQTIAPDWAPYADKLATGSDSILMRLSPAEFAAGIAAVRRHSAPGGVVEPVDVLVFT